MIGWKKEGEENVDVVIWFLRWEAKQKGIEEAADNEYWIEDWVEADDVDQEFGCAE